jgi:hypothetical protein
LVARVSLQDVTVYNQQHEHRATQHTNASAYNM